MARSTRWIFQVIKVAEASNYGKKKRNSIRESIDLQLLLALIPHRIFKANQHILCKTVDSNLCILKRKLIQSFLRSFLNNNSVAIG